MSVLPRRSDGYVALLAVLIVGAASLTIATTLLLTGTDSQRYTLIFQQSAQARVAADACVEEALQQMHDNTSYTGTAGLSFSPGSCSYTVTNTGGNNRTINASGTVGNTIRKLQVTATIGSSIAIVSWQETTTGIISTPAFVQVKSATPGGSVTSVAATYNSSQTAGNANVLAVGWGDITSTVTSVTDTLGNTYQVAAPIIRGSQRSQVMYYAKNIASGTNTITINFSGSVSSTDLRVMEYSGLDTISPLDTSASSLGDVPTASSGSFTTSNATSLIVGAGTTEGAFTAAGSGFSLRILTANSNIAEDRVVTSTGSYSATAASNGSLWVMQAAVFKAAGQ